MLFISIGLRRRKTPIQTLDAGCSSVNRSFPIVEFQITCGDVTPQNSDLIIEVVGARGEGSIVGGDCIRIRRRGKKLVGVCFTVV